ncbi:MAG TPA: histidine kinase [Herpetosiphonaceae bacterium]|nr:histidine kinase [Herpetosiphonaceae bacterium]
MRILLFVGLALAGFGLALFARRLAGLPAPRLDELNGAAFDLYIFGFAAQTTLLPLALIYLFSATPWFKRLVNGQASRRDRRRTFAALALIQLLALNYDWGMTFRTGEQVTLGLVTVAVGAWLGGWRTGLGLALLTALVRGTQDVITYDEQATAAIAANPAALLDGDLAGNLLLYHYAASLWAMAALWAAGATALLCARPGARLRPIAAFGLGALLELLAGAMLAVSWDSPRDTIELIGPNMLVSGLALLAVALMVRGAQADHAQRRADAADLALAQAEIRALQAQINPHFLFNSLNTILYFVRTDPETARQLILHLSEVFQRVLRSGASVALRDELGYSQAYLALEQARLGERLRATWTVGDEGLLDCTVPTLILQPLVENAVKHGLAPSERAGRLEIALDRSGDDIAILVRDDGVGIAPARLGELLDPDYRGPSIGLSNINRRLTTLYGPAYRLEIESAEGAGTSVRLRLPMGAL